MSVEESTAILFLAEGAAERAFYQKILEKHYSAEPAGLDNLPQPIRDLLAPLQARKPLTLRAGRADIVLIDCGGFDAIKLCLRRLMSRPELGEAVKAGLKAVIIAADLDKNPHESLKGLLASLASNVAEEDEALKLTVNNTTVKVHITAQGLKGRSDATMEIEDHLEELAEHHVSGQLKVAPEHSSKTVLIGYYFIIILCNNLKVYMDVRLRILM